MTDGQRQQYPAPPLREALVAEPRTIAAAVILLVAACFIRPWAYGIALACSIVIVRIAVQFCHRRSWFASFVGIDADVSLSHPQAGARSRAWLLTGFAVVLASAGYLQWREPYYFTQDDNYCQALPVMLQGCRSMFSGVFPEWNPYQFAGMPVASLGIYMLTYPLTYLSYLVARYCLSNEYCFLELLAVSHILIAFVGTYWAARKWGVSAPLAVACGVAFALSGYLLITGRSWVNMLTTIAWLPFFAGFLGKLVSGPVTRAWPVGFGLVAGMMYHAGFVQIWLYAVLVLMMAVAVLVLGGRLFLTRTLWFIPAGLISLAIAMPLFYVQWHVASGIGRVSTPWGIPALSLLAMLLPETLLPKQLVTDNKFVAEPGLYYFGSVFFASAGLVLLSLVCLKRSRKLLAANVWIVCAIPVLLLAAGDKGGLWRALSHVPGFDKFHNAERFLPLAVLCVTLGGAAALQRGMTGGMAKPRWLEAGAAASVVLLMLYHVSQVPPSYGRANSKPYLALPQALRSMFCPEDPAALRRVATLMPMDPVPRSVYGLDTYSFGMEQNFASVYGIPALNGYDPLVWRHSFCRRFLEKRLGAHGSVWRDWPAAIAAEAPSHGDVCRAYGVNFLLLCESMASPFIPYYPELRSAQRIPPLLIMPVSDVCPLAFPEATPSSSFPVHFTGRGTSVDVAGFTEGGTFIVNILAWPDFKCFADGRQIPFTPDDWGRIRVAVPSGTKRLEARYSPPWATGFCLAAVCAFLALAGLAWRKPARFT